MIVIDTSVLVAALLRTDGVAGRLANSTLELHAPHLIDIELVSVLRKLVSNKVLTGLRAEEALQDVRFLGLTRYPHAPLLDRAWELRNNLSPYDAAYVALAEILDAPLLTRDRRLANAPGHGARVEVV